MFLASFPAGPWQANCYVFGFAEGRVVVVDPGVDALAPVQRLVAEHELVKRCTVFFSPSKGEITARQLADWIVEDRLPVRFQMQLHKLLWNDEPGH